MGSVTMCVWKILLVLVVAGQEAWTTGSQVPILKFVDTQHTDGSYTYGFQSGDGTYKLETRYPDGRIVGKYGYLDPQGVLREASYGAEAGRGFEPKIAGVEIPPPTVVNKKQQNFEDKVVAKSDLKAKVGDIRIVNGRRAVLKRRVKASPAPARFLPEINTQTEEALAFVQAGGRPESQRSFLGNPNTFQTFPASQASDPYLSDVDLNSGSFSLSYGR